MVDPSPSNSGSDEPIMKRPASRAEWEAVPTDPDLEADLGYEVVDLEVFEADDDHLLYLPHDEDMLRDEAFIIARKADLRSVVE